MLSSPILFARRRALLFISIGVVLVAFVSLWTTREHASTSSGKGAITPDAGTIIVNSTADVANGSDGLCTLREAITAANNNVASGAVAGECAAGSSIDSDTISMTGVSGTINLTGALPNISSSMSIAGPGSSQLTVRRDTGGDYRIFNVTGSTVGISGLTATNGKTPDGACSSFGNCCTGNGGGIVNSGNLTLTDVAVIGNRSGNGITASGNGNWGGGIASIATLTMTNCTVSGNTAGRGADGEPHSGRGGFGGGIFAEGNLTMTNCLIDGNTAGRGGDGEISSGTGGHGGIGGGIATSTTGTITLTGVTISNNLAGDAGDGLGNGGSGGGIGLQGNGVLTISNSAIVHNGTGGPHPISNGYGGGIAQFDGWTVIANRTTVSGNVSQGSAGGVMIGGSVGRFINCTVSGNTAQSGGGFYNGSGTILALTNTTVTGNSAASGSGNGIITISGPARLRNTIVALNGTTGDMNGTFTSQGHNLIGRSNGSTGFTNGSNGDIVGTIASPINPQLGSLANNGGPTLTHALLATSPALDVGDNCVTQAAHCGDASIPQLATDQRGTVFNRLVDGPDADTTATVDIGAYETQVSLTNVSDISTNEDTSALAVFDVGDASTVTSVTATSNNSLLVPNDSAHLSLSLAGSTEIVTINPAANQSGTSNITVTVNRTGSGSDVKTFMLTVNPVNDAPSFTKGPDQTVNEDAGAQTIANWATSISAGAPDESGQTITFQVTANTNAGLFTVGPAISSTGTLTYTPAANAGGSATITINLKDSGGTANSGQDTSSTQSFTITITPVGGSVSFSATNFNTTESSGFTTITVRRTGDTSRAVTVDYATSGDTGLPCATTTGVASSKCDFTSALGTVKFAAGDTTKPFTVLISQDSFVEGFETFSVTLSNPQGGAALKTPATATVTIADDANEPATNPIDDASNFVRQHYHDFLNREPDASGLAFWTNQITSCGSDQACIELRRINVSAAFYLSVEFQETGYLVERIYKAAYGDASGLSTFGGAHQLTVPIVRVNEFLADTQAIGQGVVVNQGNWQQQLENNKQAYTAEFVQRSRFTTAFPGSMTAAQFVDQLNTNAGNPLSQSERDQLVNDLSTSVKTRAEVLRAVAEDPDLTSAESDRAFVLMQYFGYLRRNPNDPQDTDYTGYDFWLTKLNQFNGNFVNAEMVKAFIVSGEYRQRFGP